MKYTLLLLIVCLHSIFYAQSLEDAFEKTGVKDKSKNIELAIGTNLLPLLGLEPNLDSRILFKDKIGLRLNTGLVMKQKIFVMNKYFVGDSFYQLIDLTSAGTNINLGLRYYFNPQTSMAFSGARLFLGLMHRRENLNIQTDKFPDSRVFVEMDVNGIPPGLHYVFDATSDAVYSYKWRSALTGIDFGSEWNLSTRMLMTFDFNFGVVSSEILYDPYKSEGIQWVYDAPSSWTKLKEFDIELRINWIFTYTIL